MGELTFITEGSSYRWRSRPANISGLFVLQYIWFEARAWHGVLILAENASSCTLRHIEFCKTRREKLHEFLILHFTHPEHPGSRAVVVVDRAVKDRSQVSSIVSPSVAYQNPTEALDRVHVMGQTDNVATHLSKAYGKYDVLCTLEFTSEASDPTLIPPRPPSAIQLSTLLFVITRHQPNYNLYEYNCYWFADTVFEACKALFSGQESCIKHGNRGRCRLNLPMHATHTLPDICNEYNGKWREVMQQLLHRIQDGISRMELAAWNADDTQGTSKTAQRKSKQGPAEEHGAAHDTVQQGLERKLEAAQQRSEELEHKLEEERRAHRAMQLELEHKLAEAERRFQQLRAAREDRPTHRSPKIHKDDKRGSKYPVRFRQGK